MLKFKFLVFLVLMTSSVSSFASKVGLNVDTCESFEDNNEFVVVKTKEGKQYLVKAEFANKTCKYLHEKQKVGYEIPLCEDFSKKYKGVTCKSYPLNEFFIPVWSKYDE